MAEELPSVEEFLEKVGRLYRAAPPAKSRILKENPSLNGRWAVGDEMMARPDREETIAGVSDYLGISASSIRQWLETSESEPDVEYRIAPWTTHRDLRNHPDRRQIITKGMTTREARAAIGKAPIDRMTNQSLVAKYGEEEAIRMIARNVFEDLLWPGVAEAVEEAKELTRSQRRARRAATQAVNENQRIIDEARRTSRKNWEAQSPYRVVSDLKAKLLQFQGDLTVITMIIMKYGRSAVPDEYWGELLQILQLVGDHAYDVIDAIKGGDEPGQHTRPPGPTPLPPPPRALPSGPAA